MWSSTASERREAVLGEHQKGEHSLSPKADQCQGMAVIHASLLLLAQVRFAPQNTDRMGSGGP